MMLHLGTLAAIVVYLPGRGRRPRRRGLLGSDGGPARLSPRRGDPDGAARRAWRRLPLIPLQAVPHELDRGDVREPDAPTGSGSWSRRPCCCSPPGSSGGRAGKGPPETTWLDALLIGLAQMFAPLPGVSRSGLTVAAALALGFSRAWAVGFSLLIAVPAILGATVLEFRRRGPGHPDRRPGGADRRGRRVWPAWSVTGRSSGWSRLCVRGGCGIFLYT